ncbi:hypothetical protein LCGC14_2694100 [marine sediment metagenome]|uniref:Uncharacterized protein n=1 Tax=marine sediment metagenome TaxID=412755 RepID=A0A0F8ZHM4_9ZZZZ
MTLFSIKSMPCPNECEEGRITVYNVYDTDENGLPVGNKEICDVCEGKGYVVCSSEVPQVN